jgi:A/G-specific adenine glycosylase
MQERAGVFPSTPAELLLLAGVGRSTAAAIAAFAFDGRAAILDGNVKRVLARHAGVFGFTGDKKIEAQLWLLAEAQLPAQQDMVAYTQGLMDLGSTVCTRSRPKCDSCPLADDCVARITQQTAVLPTPRPKKQQPEKQVAVMLFTTDKGVFLNARPQTGIWAGLWSLPEYAAYTSEPIARLDTDRVGQWLQILLKDGVVCAEDWVLSDNTLCIKHTFSHFHLFLNVYLIQVNTPLAELLAMHLHYLSYAKMENAPLPSPIRAILQQHYAGLMD